MPFHPSIVHLPIMISLILPFLILSFFYFIKKNKSQFSIWVIVVALQMVTTISGYIALESGEVEEDRVEKMVTKSLIHSHEEAAEIFVGFSVISLCLGILTLLMKENFKSHFVAITFMISLITGGLAIRAGGLGGDLVYKHGAGKAFYSQSDLTLDKSNLESDYEVEEDDNDLDDEMKEED